MFLPIPFHPFSELSVHRLQEGENQNQLLGHLIFPIPSKQWRHSSEVLTDPQEFCLVGGFWPLTFQGQADTELLLFSFLKKPNPHFLRAKAKLASSPPLCMEVPCSKKSPYTAQH